MLLPAIPRHIIPSAHLHPEPPLGIAHAIAHRLVARVSHARIYRMSHLCDVLRWVAAEGTIQAISAITHPSTPIGLLLTAAITASIGVSKVRTVAHVPLAITYGVLPKKDGPGTPPLLAFLYSNTLCWHPGT